MEAIVGIVPELFYDDFLPNNFQLMIHCYSLSFLQQYKINCCRTGRAPWFEYLATEATNL
jgi:hypothetical protein